MSLRAIAAPDLDLATTLNCGQVFHWQACRGGFIGTIDENAIYVEHRRGALRFCGGQKYSTDRRLAEVVARYFALDHPLDEICASFPRDRPMARAREFCRGLRIIRQPKWECLGTFICSSMKQVAHIRQISSHLRQRFGVARRVCGEDVFVFPRPERLARATEKQLKQCALGYRAKYLRATAEMVAGGAADLEGWSKLGDAELRDRLCRLPGVGAKVANCVMLFGFERITAFPIDVWIARVLREKYVDARTATARTLAKFAASYFGRYGGYAQQYLFHHARMMKLRNT